MHTMEKRERDLCIAKASLDVKDDSDHFVRNPSADNYNRLEKAMLRYQDLVKNTKEEKQ